MFKYSLLTAGLTPYNSFEMLWKRQKQIHPPVLFLLNANRVFQMSFFSLLADKGWAELCVGLYGGGGGGGDRNRGSEVYNTHRQQARLQAS